jgi:2-iminoacetate synthase
MGFGQIYNKYEKLDMGSIFSNICTSDIKSILDQDNINEHDFLSLLSPQASECIEDIAEKAAALTLQNFGRTIQLYTPIYLSDYCDNRCVYCGFNKDNDIPRKKLSLEEVEKEAKLIASSGLKHILVLVGDSREHSPLSYIKDCAKILKKHFDSVSVEIYALTEEEYVELVGVGVDGVTIYQEVYDKGKYDSLHLSGPKKNYDFRLDAPERAAKAKMRTINIGALLGLNDIKKEIFLAGLHAKYLQDSFPDIEISVSVPRITKYKGNVVPTITVSDSEMVQIILALRLFLPRVGITVSTREKAAFRENLLGLGVTKMSAGSTTAVGGHSLAGRDEEASLQFEFLDKRNVKEMMDMLKAKGYQPILKDWMKV